MGLVLFGAGGSFVFSARKWFTGPVINLSQEDAEKTELEKDKKLFNSVNDEEGQPSTHQDSSSIHKEHKTSGVEVLEVEKVSK